jgi:hypothetical protein
MHGAGIKRGNGLAGWLVGGWVVLNNNNGWFYFLIKKFAFFASTTSTNQPNLLVGRKEMSIQDMQKFESSKDTVTESHIWRRRCPRCMVPTV